ncbi:MAG: hypothetical protein JNN12_01495 [Bacteroidetes Order II. Incertae sedis bacterium]|nr:hypothetical protein [Bacteroidetes Order II. bacterium]
MKPTKLISSTAMRAKLQRLVMYHMAGFLKMNKVEVPTQKGKSLEIWGLLSRDNRLFFDTCAYVVMFT